MLTVSPIAKFQPSRVPRDPPEQLLKHRPHGFVQTTFKLARIAEAIKTLDVPHERFVTKPNSAFQGRDPQERLAGFVLADFVGELGLVEQRVDDFFVVGSAAGKCHFDLRGIDAVTGQ